MKGNLKMSKMSGISTGQMPFV